MIKKTPWTERKFNFDFPVTYFPVVAERLRGTLPRIIAIVQNIPEDKLSKKENGKWSVKDHIGHLADLEELHSGRLDDYKNNLSILRAADMDNLKTNEALHSAKPLIDLLTDFMKARIYFLNEVEKYSEEELAKSAMHPRLQMPMRIVDMAYFVAEHDDHHLTIIREIVDRKNT